MEHLVLLFRHNIRDVIPYCQFIERVKPQLNEKQLGEYIGDDMAIDGGDAEAVFASSNVRALYEFLAPQLRQLPFMREAQVKLIFGPLEGDAAQQDHVL
jgi:hypothetical protein